MKTINIKPHAVSFLFIGLMVFSYTTESLAKKTSYAPVSMTETFSEIMKKDIKNKSVLMNKHKSLLNERYNLSEKQTVK